MKIYLHTRSLDAVSSAFHSGLIDGVLVPATGSATRPGETRELVAAIASAHPIMVCAPAPAASAGDLYREARELARISDQVIVQIPFVEDAVAPLRKLVLEGVNVCASFVFTPPQALLATKLGARRLLIPWGDFEGYGEPSADSLGAIRATLDGTDTECEILVDDIRTPARLTAAVLAGADTVCIEPEVIHTLMSHPLTDHAFDRFLNAASQHGRAP